MILVLQSVTVFGVGLEVIVSVVADGQITGPPRRLWAVWGAASAAEARARERYACICQIYRPRQSLDYLLRRAFSLLSLIVELVQLLASAWKDMD